MNLSPSNQRIYIFCFLLLLCSCSRSFSQNKVPAEWHRYNLLWVDTIWKYQPGPAQPGYFEPGFDDSHWLTVSDVFRDTLSDDKKLWPGIGTLRKKIFVPDSMRNGRAEFMLLTQMGASSVYFDGRLLRSYGTVADNAKDENVFIIGPNDPPEKPVQLDLDTQSYHTVAVYYSNHNPPAFANRFPGFKGFTAMLTQLTPAYMGPDTSFNHPVISLCIILVFCLFFCFIYFFYPYRLASLFSIFYLANFSLIFTTFLVRDSTNDIYHFVLGDNLWRIGFSCNVGWNLLFLYALYYKKMPWRSWIVVALMLLNMVMALSTLVLPLTTLLLVIAIQLMEIWRMLILGIRHKKTGFWILAIGTLVSMAGSVFIIFDYFDLFPWYLTNTQTILAIATDLSFPLTLVLHLAWEFGSSNRDLRSKLVQVNELSAKNLEQEKEKQQILSTQNETLELQVHQRTTELEQSIEDLKSAQAQLIQSEKMASLGQLTAGIAHEIQNPLNFVNNFSDINNELLSELKVEMNKGNIADANSIANDITDNEQKINYHGKRADSIVKGMLEHSRSGTGQKQLSDINALAEEYLKLAFHGMRSKDPSFNASYTTDLDPAIEKINIIPQDMGRVLLNIYSNAFYAVRSNPAGGRVQVTTKKNGQKVIVTITDNGPGIHQAIIGKIFQPFFTTKPAGSGTGLGLSLAYDIIKAHGGDISVTSEEGIETRFIIVLPIA